jgi:hypothetical protein
VFSPAPLNVYPVKSKNISPGRSLFNWGGAYLTGVIKNFVIRGAGLNRLVIKAVISSVFQWPIFLSSGLYPGEIE